MQRQVQEFIFSLCHHFLAWEEIFQIPFFPLLLRINCCVWSIQLTEFFSKGNIPASSEGLAGIRKKENKITGFFFSGFRDVGRRDRVGERTVE